MNRNATTRMITRIKRNLLKAVYSDSLPVEFIMATLAITQGTERLFIPEDRTLATVIVCIAIVRVVALLLGIMWLRLATAYVAVFSWIYFIMFVFLETPSPHLPGGIVAALANVWVAWRLQTDQHVRENIIRDAGR